MSDVPSQDTFKLDPWTASSMLQKAIRRGEVELACRAADALCRFRGQGVFRRLCTIAVEDIGIADPVLVADVVRVATDKQLRSVLGDDLNIIHDLTSRMALAVKDRSADYLFCAATQLESAKTEQEELAGLPPEELVEIAATSALPLIRRASAALLASSADGTVSGPLETDKVQRLLDGLPVQMLALNDAVLRLVRARGEPFCLTLPLLWSQWWFLGAECGVTYEEPAPAEIIGGVPLYVWDKHTAAGKRAIARFALQNAPVAAELAKWVPENRRPAAAEIAAFYADAALVAKRLEWGSGPELAHMGKVSDMLHAGCEFDGVLLVLERVRENLPHLNELRRLEVSRSRPPPS